MALLTLLLQLFLAHLILSPLFHLARNYHYARKTGLRIIISPITPYTLKWQIAAAVLGPVLHRFRWFRAIDWTCAWQDDDELHKELGTCFLVVAPGFNVLCTSDVKTIDHVLKKWREFVKPDNVNEILGTFGQNVDTSNGDDWIRHRKLTAPCFSERASTTVWTHALSQSQSMLSIWLSSPTSTTSTMIKDTSTLALNVISAVAFENHNVNHPAPGHTLSLRDALVTVMSTAISPALEGIMPWLGLLRLRVLLPAPIKRLHVAMAEFRTYMDETVVREREKMSTEGEAKVLNLISTLIKANDAAKKDDAASKARLSDVELRGNIFIFTVGGLESTAITVAYSLALLAVHPEIQDWVAEEVDGIEGGMEDYAKVFPRLKRVMAVMYETLRLYGPSPPIPRAPTSPSLVLPMTVAPSLSSSTTPPPSPAEITLPPNTQLMLNSWAPQTSSTHFSNPKTWDPRRWITTAPSTTPSPASSKPSTLGKDDAETETESLTHPTPSSGFLAWGAGPRICPGMKFSQVEYAGVLASVLRSVRVELCIDENAHTREQGGKDAADAAWDKARQDVLSVLSDSCAEPLLLHVRRPEGLRVRIVSRGGGRGDGV